MNASDRQEGGGHYVKRAIQPWDYIAANGLGYFEDGKKIGEVFREVEPIE